MPYSPSSVPCCPSSVPCCPSSVPCCPSSVPCCPSYVPCCPFYLQQSSPSCLFQPLFFSSSFVHCSLNDDNNNGTLKALPLRMLLFRNLESTVCYLKKLETTVLEYKGRFLFKTYISSHYLSMYRCMSVQIVSSGTLTKCPCSCHHRP